MNVPGSGVDLVGLLTLGVLMNGVSALWACGVAMRLRTIQAGSLIQMPVFILLFLAPVYVPIDLLNGWVEHVAKVNPITPVLESARSLLAGDPEKYAIAVALLIVGLSVFAFWARGGLRSAEKAGA